MAENYTTYTEVDPNSRITITSATRIDYAGIQRDEGAYVYTDKGANYYSGDFEIQVDIHLTSGDTNSVTFALMLANLIDDAFYIQQNDDLLGVQINRGASGTTIILRESVNGTTQTDTNSALTLDTTYYLTVARDESVGTYGTLYCYIYSDSDRTSLVDTLILTLTAANDFRYLYGFASSNAGTTLAQTGYVENLTDVTPINVSATTAALTLTAYPADIKFARNVSATTAALTLTAYDADINLDKNVSATAAALTLTAYDAIVNAATNIQAGTAALTLTTYTASLIPVISVDATTAALTLTAYPADIKFDRNVSATAAALTLTAYTAAVNAETSIQATLASLILTAYASDVNLNKNISASVASLTLTTYDATVESDLGQATILSANNFPQGATVEYKIVDALLGLLEDWTSTGVHEVQGPTKSAYYITTSVIGIDAGTSGVIYWRTDDLLYEASEAYDFVNIGLTLSRALAGGIAKEASVQLIPTTPLKTSQFLALK